MWCLHLYTGTHVTTVLVVAEKSKIYPILELWSRPQRMDAHSVDVLIIGAGIQGAWLLKEAVKRNLNAVLIGKLDHAGT